MGWSRFDARYREHPKMLRLGDFFEVGLALDFMAITWCDEYGTDGVMPKGVVGRLVVFSNLRIGRTKVTPTLVARKLVEIGRWHDDGASYRLHDYLDYSESRAQRAAARERSMRRAISMELRAAVIARDGLVCGICGGDVDELDLQLDHVMPVASGGESTVENLRVTHARCNLKKGDRWPG